MDTQLLPSIDSVAELSINGTVLASAIWGFQGSFLYLSIGTRFQPIRFNSLTERLHIGFDTHVPQSLLASSNIARSTVTHNITACMAVLRLVRVGFI